MILTVMIGHHQGAITMANGVLPGSKPRSGYDGPADHHRSAVGDRPEEGTAGRPALTGAGADCRARGCGTGRPLAGRAPSQVRVLPNC